MRRKRLLLFFSSLILSFGLSVFADKVIGVCVPPSEPMGVTIFPPNVKYQFSTPEFSFSVETNSLGFRDHEFNTGGRAGFRILALGDSFTYGWGVEIEQSWPKILESQLRSSGLDAEVANLGKPGGSPKDYADIAEKATPILKPNLIIVGVLQGDDLAQMERVLLPSVAEQGNDEAGRKSKIMRQRLQRLTEWLYPNFTRIVSERAKPQPTLGYQWKEDARTLLAAMTPQARARFESLDAHIKDAFMNGEINPSLISLSTTYPDYFLKTLELNSPGVKKLVAELAKQLERIKAAAIKNDASVIVVLVPYGIYVSPSSFKSRQRLGFYVTPEMLTASAEDEAIASACQIAGLPFYSLTQDFRQASNDLDLFFNLDGHFNIVGHKYFGEALVPLIEKKIRGE
jgi:lysophospholipase L1-like esterase